MPRMIFWNVQQFSYDKFFARRRKRASDGEEGYGEDVAQHYRKVLLNAITANDPDFIVIVEARPGEQAVAGTLLGDLGATKLLGCLRDNDTTDWALVPPLVSGSGNAGEGVLVYFRRTDDMYFTGPWRWPGSAGPARSNGGTGVYGHPYTWAFSPRVSDRKVPKGSKYNANQVERQLAGQWKYTTGAGFQVFFGSTRMPFRTTFYDNQAGKNYTIMGCHTAPGQDGGTAAPSVLNTSTIGSLPEVQQIGVNETIVVAGDFNVSLFDNATSTAAYGPFARAKYTKVVNSTGATMPTDYPARGYLTTHIKSVGNATPSNTKGYPAFGYMSGENGPYGQYDSIDNALVLGGTVANTTIANIVTGAPYVKANPPAGVPTGTLAYKTVLGNPQALNVPKGYHPDDAEFRDWTAVFQRLTNYGLVHNVSDHLPVVFDF